MANAARRAGERTGMLHPRLADLAFADLSPQLSDEQMVADFVLLDDELRVTETWIAGERAWPTD